MSNRNKYLLGAAGVSAAAIASWRTMFPWLGDDIKTMRGVWKIMSAMLEEIKKERFLVDMFESTVSKFPNKPFIIYQDRIFTYDFVNKMADTFANMALKWKLKVGDVVAIMSSNEPAFIWTFIGLQKLGIVGSFINFHQRDKVLQHSIRSSGAKILIIGTGEDLLNAVDAIRSDIQDIDVYVQGKTQAELPTGYTSMDDLMLKSHPVPLLRGIREGVTMDDSLCYIFTSGTTGLPKPAIVSHSKAVLGSVSWRILDFTEKDISYCVLPLYHSAASIVTVTNTINVGATIVLRDKFSAQNFFPDCRKYDVTFVQYIGELCRYLLRLPKDKMENVHKIRVMFGNGLRPDIWEEFQTRFKIPKIVEFFGATEGIGAFINICNKVGALGRFSPLTRKLGLGEQRLVKYDPINDQPLRDKHGRCIDIKPGEEGIVLAAIPPEIKEFYKGSKQINEKKIERNVFNDGDAYFNFGDLLYLDKDYFLYFRDRVGDTFRWKGENVSTLEVANAIGQLDFVQDANVYGVKVPGSDGRAGMAAIVLRDNQEVTTDILQKIYKHCQKSLPSYARPLFLRFVKELILTQTMKHRKIELVDEGFDPNKVNDPMYVVDDKVKTYVSMSADKYQAILTSKL